MHNASHCARLGASWQTIFEFFIFILHISEFSMLPQALINPRAICRFATLEAYNVDKYLCNKSDSNMCDILRGFEESPTRIQLSKFLGCSYPQHISRCATLKEHYAAES